jgi:hypothetical protein
MRGATQGGAVLKEAIRWQNGQVMCFDDLGQQLPSLQGRYEEVKAAVLAAATEKTTFLKWTWGREPTPVVRECW